MYYSLFILLSILAIASVQGALTAYSEKKKGLSSELQPITEHPTFTICFAISKALSNYDFRYFDLGKDFNLTYSIRSDRFVHLLSIHENFMKTYVSTCSQPIILYEKENEIPELQDEAIVVQRLQKCYRISSKSRRFNSLKGNDRSFKIEFGHHLTKNDLAPRVIIYATSDANSYGAEIDRFYNGNPSVFEIKLNYQATILFKPKKMQSSKEIRIGCADKTIWELTAEDYLKMVHDYCPDPCSPLILPNVEMVPCYNHSFSMAKCCNDIFYNKAMSKVAETYGGPCNQMEYESKILDQSRIKGFDHLVLWKIDVYNSHLNNDIIGPNWAHKWEKKPTVVFSYRFENPEMMTVYQEYIVVTFVDLIGIVGGNLSMFIGFAFYDFALDALEFFLMLGAKIKDFYSKKKAAKKNVINQIAPKEEPKEEPKKKPEKEPKKESKKEPNPSNPPKQESKSLPQQKGIKKQEK